MGTQKNRLLRISTATAAEFIMAAQPPTAAAGRVGAVVPRSSRRRLKATGAF